MEIGAWKIQEAWKEGLLQGLSTSGVQCSQQEGGAESIVPSAAISTPS